jgi:pyruvate,orthophosphate dikinase
MGDLHKLIAWGQPLIPMKLLGPGEAAADALDLDAFGEQWRSALRPGITVRGRVLETDAGIRAAMDAGVGAAVVRNRLPALVACLHPGYPQAGANASGEGAPVSQVAAIAELPLLRLLGLKGRAAPDILADSLSLPVDVVTAAYLPLCRNGLCSKAGDVLRLTRAGQEHVEALLAAERKRTDPAALLALYEEFCVLNAELKQIMTDWQVKGHGTPNDHLDAGYDAAVLRRLAALHGRAEPLLRQLARLAPRLAVYPVRLAKAQSRIAAGDHGYVARIIADSYHTVWFELHKELITLAGLNHQAGT